MEPLRELEALAVAAEEHARREHGVELDDDPSAADRVLRASAGDPGTLAACYGAWLGRLAVRRFGGLWVGLAEPVAPRLEIRGVLSSPIDAVRRRLADPAAPALPELVLRFEAWSRPGPAPAPAAWDALADDPRFAGGPPPDPEAALDPWVRAEGVRGKDVLCLGAGGGRHGPLHALAGARVTVVDLSERALAHDRRAGLDLRLVRASIDDLSPLAPASFDVVVQPVSAAYVPDVRRVYAEVARVLRPGGLYVVQHKAPASVQSGDDLRLVSPCVEGLALPPAESVAREPGVVEYVHGLDALIGGVCAAGFVVEDFREPPRADAFAPQGSPEWRACFLPPYMQIKARRRKMEVRR